MQVAVGRSGQPRRCGRCDKSSPAAAHRALLQLSAATCSAGSRWSGLLELGNVALASPPGVSPTGPPSAWKNSASVETTCSGLR